MITVQGVSKSFDGHSKVLKNVSFELKQGEILALLGSSGSGKTTLLKLLNRILVPDSGHVTYLGNDIRTLSPIDFRRLFGNVFQHASLFPYLTVSENVAFPLRIRGISSKQQIKESFKVLEFVQLNPVHYANRLPHELSGGEQQRVNVARALIHNPAILLMDEPFNALDAVIRKELQQDLLKLQQQLAKTILFVTHDLKEALLLAERIAVLHQGQLEQIDDKNKILTWQKTEFVKQLFANIKLNNMEWSV